MATLTELRETRHLSLAQLAERAGLSISTVSRVEAGTVRPQQFIRRRLAAALGLTEDEFIQQLSEARRATAKSPASGLAQWRPVS